MKDSAYFVAHFIFWMVAIYSFFALLVELLV